MNWPKAIGVGLIILMPGGIILGTTAALVALVVNKIRGESNG